jgi:hypothetical protein
MQYHLDNNKNLVITADDEDRQILRRFKEEQEDLYPDCEDPFVSNEAMYDAFESLLGNSELQWSDALSIAALTDAPVLAIFGQEEEDIFASGEFLPPTPENNHRCVGYQITGSNGETVCGARILQAWAYMDYAVRSPQQDLLEYGEAVFTLGWDVESPEE